MLEFLPTLTLPNMPTTVYTSVSADAQKQQMALWKLMQGSQPTIFSVQQGVAGSATHVTPINPRFVH